MRAAQPVLETIYKLHGLHCIIMACIASSAICMASSSPINEGRDTAASIQKRRLRLLSLLLLRLIPFILALLCRLPAQRAAGQGAQHRRRRNAHKLLQDGAPLGSALQRLDPPQVIQVCVLVKFMPTPCRPCLLQPHWGRVGCEGRGQGKV